MEGGPCPAFVNAAPQNIPCGRTIRPPTLCTAAMRPLVALSAFLDVSSLNLAVPQAPPFFRSAQRPEAASGLNIARSMSSPWRLRVSGAMAKRSPHSALTPAVLRAQAERIRTYAYSFSDGKLVDRLQKYADELDPRAKALEEESSEM